ncbi:hypothetical protein Aph02nite_44790 [Actinoplanes philippinensis]|uniref:Uncharacterized protein n=2 Tax=Actinoplanes philippinensis TaxID=35752 RepID=A0A1I2I7H8_9ACTN|nr:hypothetical protein Aph02nite_44790 [Actinoplanes philippinensis]SFF38255.1 hypothetical protein SAMN05421541_109397 [Actinoplanes philippinensis]
MDGVTIVLAAMGLGELFLGLYVLAAGRVPGGRVKDPEQIRKFGVFYILVSGFLLLQAVGNAGVQFDLFSWGVQAVLVLLSFVLGVIALTRYRPRFVLTKWRRGAEQTTPGHRD